jgi:hypothetical protein
VEVEMVRGARCRLLAVLYGSQFVPLAFCLFALTAILRERGGALQQIAVLQGRELRRPLRVGRV